MWRATNDQLVRYTEGDCWLLAYELGNRLSAPLVALCDAEDTSDWHHVAVDLGRERLVDVVGIHSREELRAFWEKATGGPVVVRDLGFFYCFDHYLAELDGDGTGLGTFVSQRDESDARALALRIAEFITKGHSHDHDHVHGWTTRSRKEPVGAR